MSGRRKFLFDHDQLISYCKGLKPKKDEDINISLIEVKQAELERRWSKLAERYEEGMTADDEAVAAEFLKTAPTKFEEANQAYQKCKANMLGIKSRLKSEESFRAEITMIQQEFWTLKLPPCDTQPFEGGYSK